MVGAFNFVVCFCFMIVSIVSLESQECRAAGLPASAAAVEWSRYARRVVPYCSCTPPFQSEYLPP